jgi:hypothetical protein
MDDRHRPFSIANQSYFKTIHSRWHRQQRKQQILRLQVGFSTKISHRPLACQGCCHYYGKAHGINKTSRTPLICGIHPYGWAGVTPCPDWEQEAPSHHG